MQRPLCEGMPALCTLCKKPSFPGQPQKMISWRKLQVLSRPRTVHVLICACGPHIVCACDPAQLHLERASALPLSSSRFWAL